MNFTYPIFLDLSGKRCLVIGNGWPAAEKLRGLVEAGARATFLSAEASPEIAAMAGRGQIAWERRSYREGDLAGYFLVIAANENREQNEAVWREAEARDIVFNAVDDPPHCNFSFASLHRQGDLILAISTNGKSPALAVRLRERFGRELGPEYAVFLEILGGLREEIAARVPDFEQRRELWYELVDSEALDQIRVGHAEEAARTLRAILKSRSGG